MTARSGADLYEEILSRLKKVKRTGTRHAMGCCLAHDDKNPSLAVRLADNGDILLHCFAGCPPLSVVHAMGMTLGELFGDRLKDSRPPPWAMSEFRQKKKQENKQWKEETILKLSANKREKGETLSRKELDRELEAYEYMRGANG